MGLHPVIVFTDVSFDESALKPKLYADYMNHMFAQRVRNYLASQLRQLLQLSDFVLSMQVRRQSNPRSISDTRGTSSRRAHLRLP